MAHLTPYLREQIVLAQPLHFGAEAALAVLPRLTPDKFIYGAKENLGGTDHRNIWQAIERVVLYDRGQPYPGNLLEYLDVGLASYLEALIGILTNRHHIHTFDFESYRRHANRVHHNGKLYRTAQVCAEIGKIADPEIFPKAAAKIEDADSWSGDVVAQLRSSSSGAEKGYKTSAEITDQEQSRLDQIMRGDQIMLIPSGVQAFYRAGLWPTQDLFAIHGVTGGGKSTLINNSVCLGAAIGLMASGAGGCIAMHSLEMTAGETLRRMAACLAGFNTQRLINPHSIEPAELERFRYYLDFVGKLPIVIDEDKRLTASQLAYRVTALHMGVQGPVRILTTDYLELFEYDVKSKQREDVILGGITKEHHILSQELQMLVLMLSQSTYPEGNKYFVAGLLGLRGSRSITHKPDGVAEIVNYAALRRAGVQYKIAAGLDDTHVWFLLQKFRGGATDIRIPFAWNPEYTQVYDEATVDKDIFSSIGERPVLFDHLHLLEQQLKEVAALQKQHPTTAVIPLADTPLAHIEGNGYYEDEDEGVF